MTRKFQVSGFRFQVFLAAAMLFSFIVPRSSFSQVPELINYQGRLVDGGGLVNGSVEMVLRLYNADPGGTLEYEDSNSVTVVDGLYSTFLGDDMLSGSLANALTNDEVYVEVEVDGTVLAPRERLASVAYALAIPGEAQYLLIDGTRAMTGDLVLENGERISNASDKVIQFGANVPAFLSVTFDDAPDQTWLRGGSGSLRVTGDDGLSLTAGLSAPATLQGGIAASGFGGDAAVQGGSASSGVGGDATVRGGSATSGQAGDAILIAGPASSGTNGAVLIKDGDFTTQVSVDEGGLEVYGDATLGDDVSDRITANGLFDSDLVIRKPGENGALIISPSVSGFGVNPELYVQSAEDSAGVSSSFLLGRNARFQTSDDTFRLIDQGKTASRIMLTGNDVTIGTSPSGGATNLAVFTDTLVVASSGNVGIGEPSPSERLEVGGNVRANKFIGDGSMLTGMASVAAWQLAGNAGTTAGVDFLGTSDNTPVQFRVNGRLALRIEPGLGTSPNLIGGYSNNAATISGFEGVIIAGGGDVNVPNIVDADFGTIGGGVNNHLGIGAQYSVIAAGEGNLIAGAQDSVVGGGEDNTISNCTYGTISGGVNNDILSGADFATVGGGLQNDIANNSFGATIAGGFENDMGPSAFFSTVAGGYDNDVATNSLYAFIGGGSNNTVGAGASYATIPGGADNQVNGDFSFAAGRMARAHHSGSFVWSDNSLNVFASTANNQFIIEADGGVGIGTNAPRTQLHVAGPGGSIDESDPASHVALVESTRSTSGGDVLALKGSIQSPGSGINFVTFFNSLDEPMGRIEGALNTNVVYLTTGSDYAEFLPRADAAECLDPGDIVGVVNGRISKATVGAQHVMVVSTAPAMLGNMPRREDEALYERVAFLGQVPVKVRGAVQAGDFIVASGRNDGTGLALSADELASATDALVVGRAWEASGDEAIKRVNTSIGLERVPQLAGTVRALEDRLAQQSAEMERLNTMLQMLAGRLDVTERLAAR